MSKSELINPFPWQKYSRQTIRRIDNPRSSGYFTEKNASNRGMRLVKSQIGEKGDNNILALYWLIDESDGVIVDAKFQVLGHSILIGIAEAVCELLVAKNYDQAQRMGAHLIDKHLRDKSEIPAFPENAASHLNLAIDAIDEAAAQCSGIPLASQYVAPPVSTEENINDGEGYPGWSALTTEKKRTLIEHVLDEDIRPYIAMDAGGIEVLDFINDRELIIAYNGACTSCYSAVGATLSYVQNTLRGKLSPEIVVVPNLDNMSL